MKDITTKAFDPAAYLRTDEDIRLFLQDAISATPEEFLHALNTAARAKGMSRVARDAGLNRESLYRALAGKSSPRFSTVFKVARALGCKLTLEPQSPA